ncbi:MAG: WbqC family protein [Paludibacter sp.]|nr:WbqC family protein [Paludibacter sp.]
MLNIDLGVFSTAYLPPIDYVMQLLRCKKIVFEINEFYIKQTYRNRCKILTANGMMDLSIPVEKPNGAKTLMKDVCIANSENWQTIHWRAIESAYSNSPSFEYYQDDFLPFFTKKYNFLFDYNLKLLQKIFELLEIDFLNFSFTETFYENQNNENISDFRNIFNPKKENESSYLPYYQVFTEKFGFVKNLSIIDLLFNLGNQSTEYVM